jgi:hypothetical protein
VTHLLLTSCWRQVDKIDSDAARKFVASENWLRRFSIRWNLVIRRKTNGKSVSPERRRGRLQRWYALFRIHLASKRLLPGFSPVNSIYPLANRWNADQVPMAFSDPKSTYDTRGVDRVAIQGNGDDDSKRLGTLQILVRNWFRPDLKRCGQPPLTMIFRGKGLRISEAERRAYHPDVVVILPLPVPVPRPCLPPLPLRFPDLKSDPSPNPNPVGDFPAEGVV